MFIFVVLILNLFLYFLVDKGVHPVNAIVTGLFFFRIYLVISE